MQTQTQTSKNQLWVDESGVKIPYSRITTTERLKEKNAGKLLKDAIEANKRLAALKTLVQKYTDEVITAFATENNVNRVNKGTITWYNFDRSIRIEADVSEKIAFDELSILAAKELLDSFLSQNINPKVEYVREMITDAFATSKGKLDTKKVLSLMKWKSKIPDKEFTDAMNLIEAGIRKPSCKIYYRISVRNAEGKYDIIDLNFSSI